MKHPFQKIALVIFAVLLVFSACKKSGNDDDSDVTCGATDFFPFMATGHEITYSYQEFLGASGDYTHSYGEQDADGNFKVALTGTPKPSVLDGIDFFYYRPCDDKFLAGLEPGTGAQNWQYKANAQKGEYWTYGIGGGNTVTYTVVANDLTVNTLAGAIPDCAKITYYQSGAINTDTIYWSDAVGWVKYDGLLFSYELKSKNF